MIGHKIVEWEEKKPYNVEFLGFRCFERIVNLAYAYDTENSLLLSYDRKGNAYCHYCVETSQMLRYNPDEDNMVSIDTALMQMPVPKEEYNIKW